LFFVLSGFLITGILYDAKAASERYFINFYVRRSLRIFPLYYAVLFFLFVLGPRLGLIDQSHFDRPLWLWFYGTNIDVVNHGWPRNATCAFWSLAVEEHFYLVWPFIIYMFSRRASIRIGVACTFFALVLRCLLVMSRGSSIASYVLTPCRMDALLIGGVIALMARNPGGLQSMVKSARLLTTAALAALVALFAWRHGLDSFDATVQSFGYTILALFFAGLLVITVGATGGRLQIFFQSSILGFFGKLAYGLYIFHGIVERHWIVIFHQPFLVAKLGPNLGIAVFDVFAIAGTALVAFASWHLFEKHFLRLKRFFGPREQREAKSAMGRPVIIEKLISSRSSIARAAHVTASLALSAFGMSTWMRSWQDKSPVDVADPMTAQLETFEPGAVSSR
jgi:peptidoglycan/LPS O-acetylase OafA/YrhL